MKEGDYCLIEFTFVKNKFRGRFEGHGTIKEMDKGYFLFVDNDNFPYLVQKSNVTKFEPKDKPVITEIE